MKLLVVLSRVPYPLEKGDKLRAFNQIKYLSKNNDIFLFCLTHKKIDNKAYDFLFPFCREIKIVRIKKREYLINIIRAFFQSKPFQTGYFFSKKAKKEYTKFENQVNPEHIYCQFIRTVELVKDSSISKTLDYQDALSKNVERRIQKSSIFLRPILQYEAKALAHYETSVFDLFDTHTIISEADKQWINHPLKEKIYVIPNGVNFKYYSPREGNKKEYDIVFTGNMQYPPNVDAAIFLIAKIMPELWVEKPSLKVLISGANPVRHLKKLASDRVTISGWVDDIRDSYSSAKIFVAPLQIGTGLQNKLLEAMAMQLPCVTSSLANQALQAKDNVELFVADTVEEYIDTIKKLLSNPFLADEAALNGQKYVHQHFNWEYFCNKLDQILQM